MIKIKNIIFDFRAISMFILQVPPTSLIQKVTKKDHCRQTLYRTINLHINGGGKNYWNRYMEKSGSFDHLPKGTGCTPWFFRISADTKLNCAFNNSGLNSKKKDKLKSRNFAFFKGYIYTRGIIAILTINAPKKRRSAGIRQFSGNRRFQVRRRL